MLKPILVAGSIFFVSSSALLADCAAEKPTSPSCSVTSCPKGTIQKDGLCLVKPLEKLICPDNSVEKEGECLAAPIQELDCPENSIEYKGLCIVETPSDIKPPEVRPPLPKPLPPIEVDPCESEDSDCYYGGDKQKDIRLDPCENPESFCYYGNNGEKKDNKNVNIKSDDTNQLNIEKKDEEDEENEEAVSYDRSVPPLSKNDHSGFFSFFWI